MDDTSTPNVEQSDCRTPLGMNSFAQKQREQFGQTVRLAMGCIDGTSEPIQGKALPLDEASIRLRLKALSQEITSQHADILELLVRFDDLQGWKTSGASHCAAWMNLEIGIGIKQGWEYLRVGRILRSLPILKALFRAGKISWSKARLISRVANEDNEKTLCHAALDASVSSVERLCRANQWKADGNSETENEQALKQWDSRSLSWGEASNGSTRIQLILPPEIAQAFLNGVECSLNQLEDKDNKLSQRRADAAVLMAETSLQNAGRQIATADRYQVIVSVEASGLSAVETQTNSDGDNNSDSDTPTKRSTVKGTGPIAKETARRIACDCSFTVNHTVNGEPVDIGRKSRIWPTAMERAIKERDQHCVWPGCTHSRHLHIHHIKHWADGGTTSVMNSACLCSHHHTQVHEGGYTIQRVENNEKRLNEQFKHQQRANDISLFDFERSLRSDKESFNKVRKLSPTSYRFRVVDAQGQDILDHSNTGVGDCNGCGNSYNTEYGGMVSTFNSGDSPRGECAEPDPEYSHIGKHDGNRSRNRSRNQGENRDRNDPSFSYETPACYTINTCVPVTVCHQ